MMKKSLGERLFDYANIIFLVLLSLVTLYPLLYILLASISDPTYVAQARGILLAPKDFTIEAY